MTAFDYRPADRARWPLPATRALPRHPGSPELGSRGTSLSSGVRSMPCSASVSSSTSRVRARASKSSSACSSAGRHLVTSTKLPNRYSYLEKVARLIGLYYHGENPDDAVYTKRSALALFERHGFRVTEFRRANMLPLTLDGALATRAAGAIWTANRALARVAGLNLLATNLELVATAPR